MKNEVISLKLKHIESRLNKIEQFIEVSQKWHFIHSMLLLVVGMSSGVELFKFIGVL